MAAEFTEFTGFNEYALKEFRPRKRRLICDSLPIESLLGVMLLKDSILIYISYMLQNSQIPPQVKNLQEILKTNYVVLLGPGEYSNRKDWIEQIKRADTMLLLIDTKTAQSEWVKQEIIWAKTSDIPILPVLISKNISDSDLQILSIDRSECIEHYETNTLFQGRISYTLSRRLRSSRRRSFLNEDHRIALSRTASLPNYNILIIMR